MSVWSVVLGAGSGTRFGRYKQFEPLQGRRLIDWSVANARAATDGVIVVLPPGVPWEGAPVDGVMEGGDTHAASTRAGVLAVPADAELIVILTASHPLTSARMIRTCVEAIGQSADASFPGAQFADAVVQLEAPDSVGGVTSLDRAGLRSLELPMVFRAAQLREAIESDEFVEEMQAVGRAGAQVRPVPADPHAIHVTTHADLQHAERTINLVEGLVAPSFPTLPALNREQMVEVDRTMIDDLGVPLTLMMENAGRSLADLVEARFAPSSVAIMAGYGGNGGGALAAGRHLLGRGVEVTFTTTRPEQPLSDAADVQRRLLLELGAIETRLPEVADVVVDGVIGYSLNGAPRGRARLLIDLMGTTAAPVVSLDIPSGIDATTGDAPGSFVEPRATMMVAAPKLGVGRARHVCGDLFLADIGVPPSVYDRFGCVFPSGITDRGPIRL